MAKVTLPEEQALLGAGLAFGDEPVSLDPREQELTRYFDRAKEILDQGGRFTDEDLHAIVARLLLGA